MKSPPNPVHPRHTFANIADLLISMRKKRWNFFYNILISHMLHYLLHSLYGENHQIECKSFRYENIQTVYKHIENTYKAEYFMKMNINDSKIYYFWNICQSLAGAYVLTAKLE